MNSILTIVLLSTIFNNDVAIADYYQFKTQRCVSGSYVEINEWKLDLAYPDFFILSRKIIKKTLGPQSSKTYSFTGSWKYQNDTLTLLPININIIAGEKYSSEIKFKVTKFSIQKINSTIESDSFPDFMAAKNAPRIIQ